MKNEATNVDHKIKACLATMEAQLKEFKPGLDVEIAIRKYLKENPSIQIPVEGRTIEKEDMELDK